MMLKFKQFLVKESSTNQNKFTDARKVEIDPDYIRYVPYPTEELQKIAVRKNPWVMKHLFKMGIKVSEEIKQMAVEKDPGVINVIKNPSEELQRISVSKNSSCIKYIVDKGINPSEEIQMLAVNSDPHAIKYIKNPSEKVQEIAVRKDRSIIRVMLSNNIVPSNKIIKLVVEKNPWMIRAFMDKNIPIPEEIQRIAVEKEPDMIGVSGYNFSDNVIKSVIDSNPQIIKDIFMPSKEMQQYALDRDRSLIHDRNIRWDPDLLKKYAGTISARDMGII